MAEKKAPAKSLAPKAKAKAPSATAKAKSEGAAAKKASGESAAPPVSVRGICSSEKCGRPLRAKGYCRKHFMAWRRGKLGAHHQYKICTKEACRKPRQYGSLCAEHAGKGDAAQAAAGAAA